jgi:hypothetical protein
MLSSYGFVVPVVKTQRRKDRVLAPAAPRQPLITPHGELEMDALSVWVCSPSGKTQRVNARVLDPAALREAAQLLSTPRCWNTY